MIAQVYLLNHLQTRLILQNNFFLCSNSVSFKSRARAFFTAITQDWPFYKPHRILLSTLFIFNLAFWFFWLVSDCWPVMLRHYPPRSFLLLESLFPTLFSIAAARECALEINWIQPKNMLFFVIFLYFIVGLHKIGKNIGKEVSRRKIGETISFRINFYLSKPFCCFSFCLHCDKVIF